MSSGDRACRKPPPESDRLDLAVRANARLVAVIEASGDTLPGTADVFDLVLSRHGRLNAAEVERVLKPSGRIITQQVRSNHCEELNALLEATFGHSPGSWTLEIVGRDLQDRVSC